MSDRPPILDVSGGSHGITVATEHALALADAYAEAGDRMRGWAADDGAVLLDGDLLESALLSPVTFAEAEAAVLAATGGPDGVVVASVAWEADALTIRVAVRATQLTDELVAGAMDRLDHDLGYVVGYTFTATLPETALPMLAGGGILYLVWSQLPDGTRAELEGRTLDEVQEWLDQHPEVVQHVVNGSGGLLEGLWDGLVPFAHLGVSDTDDAAALLAGLYSDGHAHTALTTLTVPGPQQPPADLAGLLQHLSAVNDLSSTDHPENNGTIEVQTITGPDGSVRHVVYLPGTDDLTTTPWSQDADVRDLGTNALLVSGRDNAYQQGILDAMRQAGIKPGEPVALVGHSQGGMEAAAILAHGSPYDVTNVVTAGSPTAYLDGFPPGAHVLSLENQGDVIPLLDGADNRDSAEQVTVRFDDHETSIGANHGLDHYVAGAGAVQSSGDPSIRDQLTSLEEGGFIGAGAGQEVTSQVFQITRVP
ncbi:MAG: hypothetical protein ABIO16_18620 [Nocardioides sp.]